MKPNPSDLDKWKKNDKICVVVAKCDPPSLDLVRAADLAFSKGFSTVWLCPLYVDEEQENRARLCGQVFCSEYYGATNKQLSFCSVLLDKKLGSLADLSSWLSTRLPFVKASTCMLSSERGSNDPDIVVSFRGQEDVKAKEVWVAGGFLQSPASLAERIRSGKDEHRWFLHGLWEFLIEKGLYRNK